MTAIPVPMVQWISRRSMSASLCISLVSNWRISDESLVSISVTRLSRISADEVTFATFANSRTSGHQGPLVKHSTRRGVG